MWLFLLMSCATKRLDAMEADIVALALRQAEIQAQQAALTSEIEALRGELAELAAPPAEVTAPSARAVTTTPIQRDGKTILVVVETIAITEADRVTLRDGGVQALGAELRVYAHRAANDQIDGSRVSAIRRGSLADRIGFKNGDVIHAVRPSPDAGWFALGELDLALGVATALKGATAVEVLLTRRGVLTLLRYGEP